MIVQKYGSPRTAPLPEVNPTRYRKQSSSKHTHMQSEFSAVLFPRDKFKKDEVDAVHKAFGNQPILNLPNGASFLIIREFQDAVNLGKFNPDKYYVAFFYVVTRY